jgi:hypothetical protein
VKEGRAADAPRPAQPGGLRLLLKEPGEKFEAKSGGGWTAGKLSRGGVWFWARALHRHPTQTRRQAQTTYADTHDAPTGTTTKRKLTKRGRGSKQPCKATDTQRHGDARPRTQTHKDPQPRGARVLTKTPKRRPPATAFVSRKPLCPGLGLPTPTQPQASGGSCGRSGSRKS